MADCSFNSHPFNSSGAFVLSAVAIVAVPAAVAATAAAGVVVAVVVVVGQAPPVRRPELSFFRLRVGKKCSVLQRCSIVLEIFESLGGLLVFAVVLTLLLNRPKLLVFTALVFEIFMIFCSCSRSRLSCPKPSDQN